MYSLPNSYTFNRGRVGGINLFSPSKSIFCSDVTKIRAKQTAPIATAKIQSFNCHLDMQKSHKKMYTPKIKNLLLSFHLNVIYILFCHSNRSKFFKMHFNYFLDKRMSCTALKKSLSLFYFL